MFAYRKAARAAGAAAIAACLAVPASSETVLQASLYVTTVLQDTNENMSNRGWTIRQGFVGHVDQGSSYSHLIRTDRASRFILKGYCDTDCDDLDMALLDSNGRVVLEDVGDDDTPELRFNANDVRGGTSVRVSMPGCDQQPCYYSVGLYSR